MTSALTHHTRQPQNADDNKSCETPTGHLQNFIEPDSAGVPPVLPPAAKGITSEVNQGTLTV